MDQGETEKGRRRADITHHTFSTLRKGVVLEEGKWSCGSGRQSLYSDNTDTCLE